MGYAKERGKLEKLLLRIADIGKYDEKSLVVLIDSHEIYSHTIRILKNKNPDAFFELYKNELEEIKVGKKSIKENDADESLQDKFIAYKDSIVRALEKTIKTTLEC